MSSRGSLSRTAALAACLALLLTGCSASEAPEAAAPAPTPTVTATVTPSPAPTPTPDLISCDTAFAGDLLLQFESDGLTFRGAEETEAVDTLVGEDGLRCRWGAPQTDLIADYANWSRDDAGWESLKLDLLAAGYVESGPTAVRFPSLDYTSAYTYRDGMIHYASPAQFIGWVSALQ
jgi:hypothetical protein